MTNTSTRFTRAAGICAALAGLIFIAVQIQHPPMDVASVTTNDWLVRSIAKVVMAALALVGITGMYLRQARQTRVLGLVGYLVFSVGYLLMLSTEVIAAFVLPGMAHSRPGYVNNVVIAAFGYTPTHSIGGMETFSWPRGSRTSSEVSSSGSHSSEPASLPGGPLHSWR